MGLRQFFDRRAAAVLATLVAFLLTGCGGGSTSTPAPVQPAPAITVALTPASATVQTGQSQSFTATISHDTRNNGVTWTLSGKGCSGSTCGAISGASGATIMYAAPAAAPTPPTVTLTATSVTDSTKSSTATITISAPAAPPPAIVVAVTPSMSSVQTGASQVFSATVQNDAQNKGVNWSLSLAAAA